MQQQDNAGRVNNSQVNRAEHGNYANNGMEIDLVELLFRCQAAWKLIVAFALIGTIAMGLLTNYKTVPMYKATSTIYIVSSKDSVVSLSDLSLGTALAGDYVRIFSMWEMHEQVAKETDFGYTYQQLMSMVSVNNPDSTRMIDITVVSSDPQIAASLANKYAEVGSRYISEITSSQKPNIASVALASSWPYNLKSRSRNCAIGFVAGIVLAVGIVFVRMLLDDKVKTAEDIKKYTGLMNLAVIPMEESERDIKKNSGSKHGEKKNK